jgi:hypothetical protein
MNNLQNSSNSAPSVVNHKMPMAKSNKSLNPVFVVIAIVVILGLIIGIILLTQTKSTNSDKTSSPNSTAIAEAKSLKISVLEPGKLVLPGGYADPSIIKTATGYDMYVNRQSGGPGGILIYTSTDGVTWTKKTDIVIQGVATGRAIALPTGGVRIYYPSTQPIKPTDPASNLFSSFSSDGASFIQDPGIVVLPRSDKYYIQGPTVFQLPDNTWRMYFHENSLAAGNQADGEIWGASSVDGITWTRDAKVTLQSDSVEAKLRQPWKQLLHPFVLKNPKGGYIMFYNSHSEMFAATSEDGLTWKKIGDIGIHGADLDGYFQDDGTIRVFYGDYDPKQGGGLVYMGVLKVE